VRVGRKAENCNKVGTCVLEGTGNVSSRSETTGEPGAGILAEEPKKSSNWFTGESIAKAKKDIGFLLKRVTPRLATKSFWEISNFWK